MRSFVSLLAPALFAPFAPFALAQAPDGSGVRPLADDARILLDYAQFDPVTSIPEVPPLLHANATCRLYIVQFWSTPTDADRAAVRAAGGEIRGYLPHDCHLVLAPGGATSLFRLPAVRWVGPYHPAYRLEPFLVQEHRTGAAVPPRTYNLVMTDKRRDKDALGAKITALGGEVVHRHDGGLLFTVRLTGGQLLAAAQLDEVAWIDRWSEPENDMDNARIQSGATIIESAGGYTGAGVRGHVHDGVVGQCGDHRLHVGIGRRRRSRVRPPLAVDPEPEQHRQPELAAAGMGQERHLGRRLPALQQLHQHR